MVKSNKIYSPQKYLELITEMSFFNNTSNDVQFIEETLEFYGFELWSYPLTEIDHIVENNIDVVLVECLIWDKENDRYDKIYRWFEVPEDFNTNEE